MVPGVGARGLRIGMKSIPSLRTLVAGCQLQLKAVCNRFEGYSIMRSHIRSIWRLVPLLGAALIAHSLLAAGSVRIIELNDGSRLSAAIIGYTDGVYTVESATLGRLQLPDTNIRSIHSPDGSAQISGGGVAAEAGNQLERIQQRIMVNPGVVALVLSMRQDPAVVEILNDPELMQAIASGELERLQSDPRILRLENHPTIREIIRTLGE